MAGEVDKSIERSRQCGQYPEKTRKRQRTADVAVRATLHENHMQVKSPKIPRDKEEERAKGPCGQYVEIRRKKQRYFVRRSTKITCKS
ncbi:hypothetical protein ACLOJK_041771, partial [Asimina triloba]